MRAMSSSANGTEQLLIGFINGGPYDSIALFRNGRLLGEAAGDSQSYSDPTSTDLFTVYTVKGFEGGVEALPATCKLNELGSDYLVRAEEARAEPGALRVPVRLFATCPAAVIAFSLSLRVDPGNASIRELTLDGTAVEAAGFGYFAYSLGPNSALERGEISAGVILDVTPPFDNLLPAGADQHVGTLWVEVSSGSTRGVSVPVEFFERIRPPSDPPSQRNIFTDKTLQPIRAETSDGAILVGASPIPEVEGALAQAVEEGARPPEGALGAGGGIASGKKDILLQWKNPVPYDSIRIEPIEVLL